MIEFLPVLLSVSLVFLWGVLSLLTPRDSRVRNVFLTFGWIGQWVTLGGVLATFFMSNGLFERGWILPKEEELALKISFGIDRPAIGVLVAVTLFTLLSFYSGLSAGRGQKNEGFQPSRTAPSVSKVIPASQNPMTPKILIQKIRAATSD